eukprot:16167-Heterococcus_DN1.PRE.1
MHRNAHSGPLSLVNAQSICHAPRHHFMRDALARLLHSIRVVASEEDSTPFTETRSELDTNRVVIDTDELPGLTERQY